MCELPEKDENDLSARKGEFPHMAAIGWRLENGNIFICGGSLISERFVLTVAHCGKDSRGRPPNFGEQNLKIREAEMSEIDVEIAEFIPHKKFNYNFGYYDIAVIKLSRSVEFNKFVKPACLSQPLNQFG